MNHVTFNKDGLVPAIVQDASTKEVLTLAYMNEEALNLTIETKESWFYSRSREALWHKGATSGNKQTVVDIRYDCDQDAVLLLVEPLGPACHTGSYSCFTSEQGKDVSDPLTILKTLEKTIASRKKDMPEGAYTTYLFNEGLDKILKKVGEEASEVIIAAKNNDHTEMHWEVADLLYHVLVLLEEKEIPLTTIMQTLEKRHNN
ncbi:bifunctional phosphoribosyl-AMP cyclohydrolase/phosphoribosyl-ATP diphosphatase HisIE [Shouchella sp. JSM 1781072]|uniref:bifunctional phosphoribosyl-AMP cyclohydrolase/phosphoribosyl-ATP diphosphatase HisIE n=1 Tax=Shouchella sp. JSM 1781072 TaxID=3344581 RepID=UPI0035C1523D